MPKPRETCTECSRRRQKCDKGTPCGRCVKRGKTHLCTRQWTGARALRRDAANTRQRQALTASMPDACQADNADGLMSTTEPTAAYQSDHDISTLEFMTWRPSATDAETNHNASSTRVLLGFDAKTPDFTTLQLLMPNVRQMWKLVSFHEKRLLWYHGCYHGPSFNTQLEERLKKQNALQDDVLQIQSHDLLWIALLFSVLVGSLTSAAEDLLAEWGFSTEECSHLRGKWYQSAITALQIGHYTSDHRIESVQAIATLSMSAHTLGFSSDLHVLLGTALRIAQSLNLHRIRDNDHEINVSSSAEDRQAVLKKEIGRRLWSQLCIQDWCSIPLAEAHSIHRGHFNTQKPGNRDHLTMEIVPNSIPTYVSYSNYLYDIAALIAELHEVTVKQNTEYTRYRLVLEYDLRMRVLATRGRPRYFDATVDTEGSWPWFVPWARRSLTICFAHKAMMLHRAFLKRSFTNEAFSMTRRTCIAASKTIINEAILPRDSNDPIIWIDHAFCIAAAITLALDASYRKSSEPEYDLHRHMVIDCIELLRKHVNSTLACRGVHLLRILLHKSSTPQDKNPATPHTQVSSDLNILDPYSDSVASALELVHNAKLGGEVTSQPQDLPTMVSEDDLENRNTDYDYTNNILTELFPSQTGFSNIYLFEELLGMNVGR